MTDQEIRIAIAECGGAKVVGWQNDGTPVTDWPDGTRCFGFEVGFPNYQFDLNAIHEAEKFAITNIPNFDSEYWIILATVTNCTRIDGKQIGFSTARQRAEALLRTLNKWID